ncbi:lysophospholipid acyltransferase family protein [Pseudidiomarina salinarum]|uniref:lysophospholipid acyltransferase family protein n=1 Tax=Pseudidiomarina salinarum TaxID=435908 RepID=UPI000A01BD9E|nr:lysophospholipid acyltransferase family protein [Pseudidiomarina salinarum]RUO71336.1 1-acyl-sn-glycerol-3-phosphate acyltransferase [Pseudidiomarina salinarum]
MFSRSPQFIERTWRRLMTGFCFAVFGLGGIVLSVTALPLLRLRAKGDEDLRQRLARQLVKKSFVVFIKLMRFSGVFNFDFKALEETKNIRGKIVIANHPSLIDVVALISLVPNADCVVKAHLWRNPFMRGVIRSTGYISNGDPEGLIADCKRSLDQGNNLVIFPEGTRTAPGNSVRFRRGAANLALRTQKNLITFRILCDPPTLLKNEPWYCAPIRKPTLAIQYLREFDITQYQTANNKVSIAARRLTRDLQTYYDKVLEINEQPEPGNQSTHYRVARS